ncbi:3-phosphoshikimate 1-carboxyvinyltransferase [Burkholderia pseudomallei]|uniref:3-phosphoshikimate 1-carboxyvinyltransferase n=1 Tax=Burkholderia pseudomallei TaxID=28450 RepID=UPI000F076252|nr:3-phosphoshikimate 1-carboxyvinyltransferase [Burkholderia pseudomallei]VCE12340.1 3-phosphoshikimate 1-carboxyvinyltransferase [Burkholderia pseudomallei]VCE34894.1 3-phosphoshikimate 1-carboxyvinyltransferase [Burkholderia pseudomallei]VCE39798.1 3-phosphoshikimate 1-carboxyvinyltransferase [Burkholderia pseudomallei]VCE52139.1 3-phosphoshikimate 1-carboxyvinyltransferase [Burkholderia pseudomallei]VCE68678.1 3-phosphoshikimate 1-carboxyvinyltransferase [Burkholderia pseudomallei]
MTTSDRLQPSFVEVKNTSTLSGTIDLPASKSSSTRALLTAALTPGISTIRNVATGFNSNAMKHNCERLGASFSSEGDATVVKGVDVMHVDREIVFDPGNSGVVLRLLMGVAGYLPDTRFVTQYRYSLGVRSQAEMVAALRRLNVECEAVGPEARLPISMRSTRALGKHTEVSCKKSSQFLSGLLYLGAIGERDLEIDVVDHITAPSMVHTTINNLAHAGVAVEYDAAFRRFFVPGRDRFKPSEFTVGADPASTAAILALCGSLASDVTLNGFFEEELGSGAVIRYLTDTGTLIDELPGNRIRIRGGTSIRAQDFDGSLAPDAVPALAGRAAFAEGTSTFYNIEHIRYKESDRISDFRRELDKLGVRSEEKLDQLLIHGNPRGYRGGAVVDGHYDHGLIMALTTIGLHCEHPVLIKEPHHVGQTYPDYFADIGSIGANVDELIYPNVAAARA